MTKCGDLFRYVPQIEQVGLDKPITKREVMMLLERDRQLEDYLSTLECGDSGPHVAWFNNSTGALSGGFQVWNQVQTRGDRTWFTFPYGGTDKTRIKINEPGIFTLSFHATTPTGNFDIDIDAGGAGHVAHGTAVANSPAGSGVYDQSMINAAEQLIRASTSGTATTIYSQLALAFWPGEPTFDSY